MVPDLQDVRSSCCFPCYAVLFFFLLSGYFLEDVYRVPERRTAVASNFPRCVARLARLLTFSLAAVAQFYFISRTGHAFVYACNDAWHA
jgi:hypothetical protein